MSENNLTGQFLFFQDYVQQFSLADDFDGIVFSENFNNYLRINMSRGNIKRDILNTQDVIPIIKQFFNEIGPLKYSFEITQIEKTQELLVLAFNINDNISQKVLIPLRTA